MESIEQLITDNIKSLRSQYIDCDENGLEGIKNSIGNKLKKLNKCLKILNS